MVLHYMAKQMDYNIFSFEDITYEFTRNRKLLEQYFQVREEIYVRDFKLDDYSTHIDNYDFSPHTHILVVKEKGNVIGGSRVIFHKHHSNLLLPLEDKSFLLSKVMPKLNLHSANYTEINRTILKPEFREGKISRRMIAAVTAKSVELGANYLFTINPIIQARNNRKHASHLGIDFQIKPGVKVKQKEEYEGKKMFFAMARLDDLNLKDITTKALAG